MKIIAALVIGLYMMLATGILSRLISQWRRERKPQMINNSSPGHIQ
jgi:hypothetical protein